METPPRASRNLKGNAINDEDPNNVGVPSPKFTLLESL